ncbi:MAG: GTP cyclohydrolase I [Phycisphaerales bacterium]|nr:GTP cyclohydrolase I [Phycisphaerales bacterium]
MNNPQMPVSLTQEDVKYLCRGMHHHVIENEGCGPRRFYAIPRGGVPVGYMLQGMQPEYVLVDDPDEADFFVDDIIDTGKTMDKWTSAYPGVPFYALLTRGAFPATLPSMSRYPLPPKAWIHFPWESIYDPPVNDDTIVGTLTNRLRGVSYFANDNIAACVNDDELDLLQDEVTKRAQHFLRGLLIDVDNDHNTRETAARMAKMYLREVFRGRYEPPPSITDFPNAKALDEMYITGPITIRSMCSHHLVPIIGRCWVGVIPGECVIGLSKFNRIADWIASRPQIQEEMVVQLADYIEKAIKPKGLAVVIEASHMCMTLRGVQEPMDATMKTNVMRGAFRDKPEARAEFMAMVAKG